MVTDVKQSYCGDHSAIYRNVKSFCCTPETSNVVCELYLNKKYIFKKKRRMAENELSIHPEQLKHNKINAKKNKESLKIKTKLMKVKTNIQ